jgi:hypothetical protein
LKELEDLLSGIMKNGRTRNWFILTIDF